MKNKNQAHRIHIGSLRKGFLDFFTCLRRGQALGVNILFFRILVTLLKAGELNANLCHKFPAISWWIPTGSILGNLKIIFYGLGNMCSAEHRASSSAGGRFLSSFLSCSPLDLLSAILVLLALAGEFSLSLELLWTVGLELEKLFLHGSVRIILWLCAA